MSVQFGQRIGNELLTSVRADESIRPLRDQIVVEPLDVDFGTSLLQVIYGGKPVRGRVLAVGPGLHPRKYDGPKGKRTHSWLSRQFRPTEVQVGDLIDLGGLELGGYLFTRIRWGEKDVIICREQDVCGIVEGNA